jgi:F0F1-type ATP synthase membrane subunit b/b'
MKKLFVISMLIFSAAPAYAGYLDRKYEILRENADAEMMRAQAEMMRAKSEAERVRAQGDAEMMRAQAERARPQGEVAEAACRAPAYLVIHDTPGKNHYRGGFEIMYPGVNYFTIVCE